MEIYVGTSGWLYAWNAGKSLKWYVQNSGLNAVELNSSFYRMPTARQTEKWAAEGSRLRWAVKIYRGITHFGRLSEKTIAQLEKFLEVFQPLDKHVDFYLFQMPPSFSKSGEAMRRVEKTASRLGRRAAFEFRHRSWFVDDTVRWAEDIGFTLVSVDSPEVRWIKATGSAVYLRMHGRTLWYSHYYDEEELAEVAREILRLNPAKVYVFFNNNHGMLENARTMLKLLRGAY